MDLPYGTLHAQIKNNRAIPFLSIDLIASYFGVSADYFSERRASLIVRSDEGSEQGIEFAQQTSKALMAAKQGLVEMGLQISTDHILDWLNRENNTLKNHEQFAEKFDLFYPVKERSGMLVPKKMGKESLATIFFDIRDEQDYVDKVGSFPPSTLRDLIRAHVHVQKSSTYQVDDMEIAVRIDGRIVAGKYRRVLAPVTDLNGQKFTFVFARLIEAFQPELRVRNVTSC